MPKPKHLNRTPPGGTIPPLTPDRQPPVAAEWGTIPTARVFSGRSRSWLYRAAAVNPGLFRKAGRATVVNLRLLSAIMEALPLAEIGTTKRES
jgi:hypothetical protein